jgi:hypothetical protein
MGKRTPNHWLVKIHRNYTVEEITHLFGNHKKHCASLGEGRSYADR